VVGLSLIQHLVPSPGLLLRNAESETMQGLSRNDQESRLLAEVTECYRLSRAASAALTYPVHSMIYNGEPHRKLIEADRVAHASYDVALLALRTFRKALKARP
jgi:hypothetical protein